MCDTHFLQNQLIGAVEVEQASNLQWMVNLVNACLTGILVLLLPCNIMGAKSKPSGQELKERNIFLFPNEEPEMESAPLTTPRSGGISSDYQVNIHKLFRPVKSGFIAPVYDHMRLLTLL